MTALEDALSIFAQEGLSPPVSDLRWIDWLLAWYVSEFAMTDRVANRFVSCLTQDHLSVLDSSLYQLFLPSVANNILGFEVFEQTAYTMASISVSNKTCARALAFGACRNEWLPSDVESAREACYCLQKFDLIGAVHSLCCLTALVSRRSGEKYHLQMNRFLEESRSYLQWVDDAIANPQLRWEISIWDNLRAKHR